MLQQVGVMPCSLAPQVQKTVEQNLPAIGEKATFEALEEAVEHVKAALRNPEAGTAKMRSPSTVAFRRWQNNMIEAGLKRARDPTEQHRKFVETDPDFEWES
jgi:hypothetical protein